MASRRNGLYTYFETRPYECECWEEHPRQRKGAGGEEASVRPGATEQRDRVDDSFVKE